MKNISTLEKSKKIAEIAADKKGDNIVIMEMSSISTMCDNFVIISASSSRRLTTIFNTIHKEMSKIGVKPSHSEGRNNPYWALLDYGDVIVHVFYEEVRDFYGLERLWSDASKEKFIENE